MTGERRYLCTATPSPCGIEAMRDFPKVKTRVRFPAGTLAGHCQTPYHGFDSLALIVQRTVQQFPKL